MLLCGVSEQIVTPDHQVALAGYAARGGKVSTGTHDDLYAKAFFFRDENSSMLMLFADVEGLTEQFLCQVRQRIREQLNIENVSFSATHTHSAPHTYPQVQLKKEEMDTLWVAQLQNGLFSAAQNAVKNPFPALLGFGSIEAPRIAHNRRTGHTLTDPTLSVLQVSDYSGEIRGLILTFSCHCTVLDAGNFLVSADYPGEIYRIMRQRHPHAVTAFGNGSAGDINIGYSSDASALGEKMEIRTFENASRIATALCDRVAFCQKGIQMRPDVAIHMESQSILLPLRKNLPSEASLWAQIYAVEEKLAACTDEGEKRKLKLQKIYLQCFILRLHGNESGKNAIQATSKFIHLGHRLYITIPGELFAESGLRLKRMYASKFDPVILGYSNGYVGYLPSLEAMQEGGYESETSIFAPDVEDALLKQLEKAPETL